MSLIKSNLLKKFIFVILPVSFQLKSTLQLDAKSMIKSGFFFIIIFFSLLISVKRLIL